jgi:hypothetical protein
MRAELLKADGTFDLTPSHFMEPGSGDDTAMVAVDVSVTWTISKPGSETLFVESERRPLPGPTGHGLRQVVLLVRRGCGGSGDGELPDTLYPTRA